MNNSSNNLSTAIRNILNDVIEQCFRQLMQQPAQRPYIESIVDRASTDILMLEKKVHEPFIQGGFSSDEDKRSSITKTLYNKSLDYLSELQRIKEQTAASIKDVSWRP